MEENQETITDIIAEKRRRADEIERDCAEKMKRGEMVSDCVARELVADIRSEADRLEAARKREVDKLNSAIQATVGRSDAEIDRLRREIAELQGGGNAAKLPDGWKMYDKYQIRHTDGTPLKGKRYFVLRLDSDDPLEAARVAAAMSAYKGETPQGNCAKLREVIADIKTGLAGKMEQTPTLMTPHEVAILKRCEAALAAPPRNCDVGTADEQDERFHRFCVQHHTGSCARCHSPVSDYTVANGIRECALVWAQMPYEEGGAE